MCGGHQVMLAQTHCCDSGCYTDNCCSGSCNCVTYEPVLIKKEVIKEPVEEPEVMAMPEPEPVEYSIEHHPPMTIPPLEYFRPPENWVAQSLCLTWPLPIGESEEIRVLPDRKLKKPAFKKKLSK